ncbi:uncharacterized protein LOC129615456 [Condylostylus longicornis]|uniref:uncharacterized protein LOC129615456 n=1 Tax=Condylostylus longicornis TaxID=2530218 RepID=UPI00244DE477|nr:uncharacterized protein LOC129615456 [Condylostylus longicornis]
MRDSDAILIAIVIGVIYYFSVLDPKPSENQTDIVEKSNDIGENQFLIGQLDVNGQLQDGDKIIINGFATSPTDTFDIRLESENCNDEKNCLISYNLGYSKNNLAINQFQQTKWTSIENLKFTIDSTELITVNIFLAKNKISADVNGNMVGKAELPSSLNKIKYVNVYGNIIIRGIYIENDAFKPQARLTKV